MDTVTRPAPVTDTPVRPLGIADRCDRCGSRAYVRALLPGGGSLQFCGHHANAHRPALLVAGADLHDQTSELTERRESSAAA